MRTNKQEPRTKRHSLRTLVLLVIGFVAVVVSCVLVVASLFLREMKRETVSGILTRMSGNCVLASPDTIAAFERCGRDDALCQRLAMLRSADGPFGLEDDLCTDHPSALGRFVNVRGTRVPGDDIDQNCSNRSCFDDAELTHAAPQTEEDSP